MGITRHSGRPLDLVISFGAQAIWPAARSCRVVRRFCSGRCAETPVSLVAARTEWTGQGYQQIDPRGDCRIQRDVRARQGSA